MRKITKDKLGFILLLINIILFALSISYFSYSLILLKKIETILRIGIILFFVILAIISIIIIINCIYKKKRIKIILITILTIIFSSVICFVGYNINKIYSAIANVTTNTQTYSASLVTNINNAYTSIDDIKEEKIGILSDKESIDGYQIPQEIIKENNLDNEIIEYNNYLDLINDLLDEKINVIFLPTNYSILFGNIEGLHNLDTKTKIIYTKDKNIKIEKTLNSKNIDQPFTILLMGVDSENEEIKGSSFNGDSLILATFNPKTLNTTILSIPRDSYVPITCFAGQKKNKITHAAWYGESCMMSTIENVFDVTIDYYVKINFKGVVNIVNALGGVDVNVPYNFCESNSNREIGGNSTIYVREGFQTLDGEQALALARNRHPWPEYCSSEWTDYNSNDFVRGQNQQLVIQGMLNKIKNINSIDTFYDMLNSISNSMETNMSTENILSFYNVVKDILMKSNNSNQDLSSLIGFERMYLSGYDQMIVDYDGINNTGSGLQLYNFIPYQGSIQDISDAMKVNLELKEQEINKKFDFDINKPYEKEIIGEGYYDDYSLSLLPSFVGDNLSYAQNYCSARGIKVYVNKISTSSKSLDGQIMTQSLPSGMDAQYAGSITFSVAEYKETAITEPTIPGLPENDKKTTNTNNENTNTTTQEENIDEQDDEEQEISKNETTQKTEIAQIPGTPEEKKEAE